MAATNDDIKNFFALSGNNPTITNARFAKISDWMKAVTGWEAGDPEPGAGTLVDLLYADLEGKVKHWLKDQQTVTF